MKLAIIIGLLAVAVVVSPRSISFDHMFKDHRHSTYNGLGSIGEYYGCLIDGHPRRYCLPKYDCSEYIFRRRFKQILTTTTTARPEVIHKQEATRPSQQESYTTQKTTSTTTERSSEMGITEEYKVIEDVDQFDSRPFTKESSEKTVDTNIKSDKEFYVKRTKRHAKRPYFEGFPDSIEGVGSDVIEIVKAIIHAQGLRDHYCESLYSRYYLPHRTPVHFG